MSVLCSWSFFVVFCFCHVQFTHTRVLWWQSSGSAWCWVAYLSCRLLLLCRSNLQKLASLLLQCTTQDILVFSVLRGLHSEDIFHRLLHNCMLLWPLCISLCILVDQGHLWLAAYKLLLPQSHYFRAFSDLQVHTGCVWAGGIIASETQIQYVSDMSLMIKPLHRERWILRAPSSMPCLWWAISTLFP